MTADSDRPKLGIRKYGGCIFIPTQLNAACGFSMHPAVLMAISDFEINYLSECLALSRTHRFDAFGSGPDSFCCKNCKEHGMIYSKIENTYQIRIFITKRNIEYAEL